MTTLAPPPPRSRTSDLVGLLGSTDHKRIAGLIGGAALVFFLMAGTVALLMRIELAAPGMQLMDEDLYNQLFTAHGSVMIYFFAIPAVFAFGLYLVPLQVGAAEISWPRLALAGFWLFLAGGVIMWAGFLTTQGAAQASWIGIDPLSDSSASPGQGMDFWIIAVFLTTLAQILWAACVLATIVRRRAPGMTMLRIPVFCWAMVVTSLMTLTAFPALDLGMVLLYVERHIGGVFTGPNGAIAYQHLFWFYGHPAVYVVFFPPLAAVSETIAVNARKRFFGYRALVVSLLVFAAGSMSVWGHHMFTTGSVANRYFALTSTFLMVPAGVEYFDNIATMWGGRIRLRTSMLFACGFLLMFLIGGLSGIYMGSAVLDYHIHDTYFIVAHFHYTLFGGTVFGIFAGVFHWFPKVTGRLLDERLGKGQFWLMVLGILLTFIPQFFLGHDGMLRRVANYEESMGWQTLNVVSTVGAGVLFVAIAVFLVNLVRSIRHGAPAGGDPWGGHTLEWATSSPPPRHNFDFLPPVRSYAPLLDLQEEAERARRSGPDASNARGEPPDPGGTSR